MFLLGYLWNKNIDLIDDDDRESIFEKVIRPTTGQVVEMCRILDMEQEFFGGRPVVTRSR